MITTTSYLTTDQPGPESELLAINELSTSIRTRSGMIRPVDHVTMTIGAGEAIALVGESGCGKTMTALSTIQLLPPTARITGGTVRLNGRNLVGLRQKEIDRVRGAEIGMVFQDPMTYLNPLMTVGAQISEVLRKHRGLKRAQAWQEAGNVLDLVGLPHVQRVMHEYPHRLSGGMRQRVLIAIAVACRPRLLIADEPTTALDVTLQAQIMRLINDLRAELQSAVLLITHDLGLVAELCERMYVMYASRIVEHGRVEDIFARPRHPYTRALLESTLSIEQPRDFIPITGQPPNLLDPPAGCRFHPRCPQAMDRCYAEEPRLSAHRLQGAVACWVHDTADEEEA